MILVMSIAEVNNERVFNIANRAYRDNQYFDSKTFSIIIILNRYYFKKNLNLYRYANLINNKNLIKEKLKIKVERRKNKIRLFLK